MLTVTVAAVLPPRAFRSAAAIAVSSASLTVTVMASVEAVARSARSAREAAPRVAVTTPVVLAVMAFSS